ncbi:MAG: S-layer homology domain-containing protein, partial [Oscillospiraceae bacterium]
PVGANLSTIAPESFVITPCTGATVTAGPSKTDDTTWKFTVTAEDGIATKEYTVKLTVATEFFAVTDITGVPTKTLVNLPLTLTGTTDPVTATNQTITWSIDGSSALKETTDVTLTTGVLTANKAGIVTVKATIAAGVSEAGTDPTATPAVDYTQTFDIVVSEPTIAPATKTIGLGQTATFTVTAASDAPLTYQWQTSTDAGVTWSDISGATAKSYITNAAATAGETHYKCVLSYGAGTLPTELTATLTVEAKTPRKLTVSNGTIRVARSSGSTTGEYLPGDTVTLVANPAPDGKVFSKWTATPNIGSFHPETSATTTYTMPDAEVTVTANYADKPVDPGPGPGPGPITPTEKTYTLTFSTGNGSAVEPLSVKEAETVLLSAYTPTLKDFEFDGWYADKALTKPISTITLTEDTTVYAKWIPARELPFTDVTADDWFQKAVEYVYRHDIMNGVTDSEFSPYFTTTRGMIVTVLWRMEGQPAATTDSPFHDLTAGWYREAVDWAAEFDIVLGYDNGNFGPLDDITREQMAAIFYRYAKYKGYDVTATADLSQFSDLAMVSQYAVPAMRWAIGAGLLQGDNGKLMPRDDANRAQLATILYRFCENLAKQSLSKQSLFGQSLFDQNRFDQNLFGRNISK